MSILLSPELEQIINQKVESGLYDSANEVVRESLRLLQEQDEIEKMRREEVRREVMKGVEQIRNGQYKIYNSGEELAEEIIRRGTETLTKNQKEK